MIASMLPMLSVIRPAQHGVNRLMQSITLRLFLALTLSACSSLAVAQNDSLDDSAVAADNFFDDGGFGGPFVSDSGVGYIDSAILGDQLRFRFDATYNNTQPARAEFVWPVDGAFGPGPGAETRADYQDLSLYGERVVLDRVSVFGELPFRMLNPELQDNTSGLGDANVGFKYELRNCGDTVMTAQLRTYLPTGAGTRGLGTRHVSLEPSLLMWHRYNDRLTFEAEVRDWISIGGSDGFAGNVLRYGLGAGYVLNPCDNRPLSAVVEFVGWTVLNGGNAITTNPPLATTFVDATGDTIVNAKVGLRYQVNCRGSFYVGYGHALTSQTWYEDVMRAEYRLAF